MEIFRNASNAYKNRQFQHKCSDMDGNRRYEAEKDGDGEQRESRSLPIKTD